MSGFGVALATAQLTGVVLTDVPIDMRGEGSGTSSTARQIGSSVEKTSQAVAEAARIAFSDGTRASAFAAAAFLVVGLLATLRLSGRRETDDEAAPTV